MTPPWAVPGKAEDIAKARGEQLPMQIDEVRREAKGRSRRLYASQRDLRAILDRHEDTVRKRWSKKTKAQRQAILLKVWPNMAAVHRPDLEAFKLEEGNLTGITEKYRDCFVWPHINQEDLSKSNILPLLVNARGRHDPCKFASTDNEAMCFGMAFGVIKFCKVTNHVMILNGVFDPDEYGKLFALNEHPDAMDWLVSRTQFSPERGLVILEAQEMLLSFLVGCCKEILHDIPDQALTSEAFPIKSPPQTRTEAETNGFNSLAVMAAEAPYRLPERLDFGRIEDLLAARVSALEDHMWSLREDPGYFANAQRELMEHRREQIKDINGKPHMALGKSRIHLFRASTISYMVELAYMQLETYAELQLQAQNLRLLQQRYSSVITLSKPLPEAYLQAILRFRQYLRGASIVSITHLQHCLVASPPIRRLFVCDRSLDPSSKDAVIASQPGQNMDSFEMKLIRLISFLWEKESVEMFIYMQIVIDDVERLIDSEHKAKELVSPYIARIIGELSVISQCLTQLDLYQPWASGFEFAMGKYRKDIQAEFLKGCTQLSSIKWATQDKTWDRAVRLGDVSTGRFEYPIDKRRTRENVETLRKSEGNLDAFWASVDELVLAKAGNLGGAAVQRLLSQPRIMQRTPEWAEPMRDSKKKKTPPTTNKDVEALYKPLSALYFGLNSSKTDSPGTPVAKTKIKTRGTAKASPPATAADDFPENPSPPDPQPTIAVDARSLKVFRTLFFNPSPTAMPGEVAWNDFLHALTSTGFTAQKLYGSVWQFRPVALGVGRSIQFHEPHPSGKIPFRDARRHGRRLNRAYGWCGGMFALKEK